MEANPNRTPQPQPRGPRVPALVGAFNPIVMWLARLGIPIGPNALLTVRGRKTGQARTTPVAVIVVSGRRWVQSPFGEVNWVRNLRATGEGTLTVGRRQEPIHAVELSPDEVTTFFRDVLGPYVRRQPLGRLLAGRLGLGAALDDPAGAARSHPVFELKPGAP